MKKLNLVKYIFVLFLVSHTVSCNSWLDVDAKDKIMEDDVFSTRAKFLSTLNGVYLGITSDDLYGSNLSYGMIDVMGQYYNAVSGHKYVSFCSYSYGGDEDKKRIDKIWKTAYNMIINCNTILEHCGESNEVLGPVFHPIVKGEALALRAMLHFDVLRLFGPIYNDANKSKVCIPYMITSDPIVAPLESSESIISKVVADLESALKLLANDPIITEGALNSDNPTGINDLYYRQYRLNYYAVKALLARVHLWEGNKVKALKYATEVIAEGQKAQPEGSKVPMVFPFVTSANAIHAQFPDRIFSTEVIFGLYNILRKNVYENNYAPTLATTSILTFAGQFTGDRIAELYPDQNDYRYKMWASATVKNKAVIYCQKFDEVVGSTSKPTGAFRYMMSLIRISEMYLIAAECTPDITDAMNYINTVRKARNCVSTSADESQRMNKIIEEFRREMIGEGQMFFLYKRLAMQNIPDAKKVTGNKNIQLGSYTLPLPDSEISQRPDYVK